MGFVADIFGKGKPDAPPAPDYNAVAKTQGAANVDTAKVQARLNNPNIYGPNGGQTVSWNGDTPSIVQYRLARWCRSHDVRLVSWIQDI